MAADTGVVQAGGDGSGRPSTATRVVTDGAADLPPGAPAVAVVRGPVHVGGRAWDGDPGRFWAGIGAGQELPATEAPSVEQLTAAYTDAGEVLAVHVSSELSRTVVHARQAAAAVRSPVRVVDSRSLSVGTGLVVMAAAEAVAAGVDGDRLAGMVEGWVDQLHVHAVIDDVRFLVDRGRAGLVGPGAGHHARRRVVAVKGHVIPIRQVRHRDEAIGELVGHAREHAAGGVTRWAVGHGDAADVGEFVERMIAVFGSGPSYVTLLGPPVGAHMGPRALVVGFFSGA